MGPRLLHLQNVSGKASQHSLSRLMNSQHVNHACEPPKRNLSAAHVMLQPVQAPAVLLMLTGSWVAGLAGRQIAWRPWSMKGASLTLFGSAGCEHKI